MASEPGGRGRLRFPALDVEPPRRPWWRLLIVPAVIAVLAGGVTAAVMLVPTLFSGSKPTASGSRAASGQPSAELVSAGGRIVSVIANQSLALSAPSGKNVTELAGLGPLGQVWPALDSRYLAVTDGQVVSTTGARPGFATTKVTPFSGDINPVTIEPFADHDRAMVAQVNLFAFGQNGLVSVLSLSTGRSLGLGVAGVAAGDPRAAGAFESIVAPVKPSAAVVSTAIPDSKVVLRDAGRPTALLATATALNSAVGLAPREPVMLSPYPSPSGGEIAVVVQPTSGKGADGLVVLTRAGKIAGTISAAHGPLAGDSVSWSPSNASLVYPATGPQGQELAVWTVGGSVSAQPFPHDGRSYGSCLWSPDGKSILCVASAPTGTESKRWVIANTAGRPMAAVTGPGFPVAWLP